MYYSSKNFLVDCLVSNIKFSGDDVLYNNGLLNCLVTGSFLNLTKNKGSL